MWRRARQSTCGHCRIIGSVWNHTCTQICNWLSWAEQSGAEWSRVTCMLKQGSKYRMLHDFFCLSRDSPNLSWEWEERERKERVDKKGGWRQVIRWQRGVKVKNGEKGLGPDFEKKKSFSCVSLTEAGWCVSEAEGCKLGHMAVCIPSQHEGWAGNVISVHLSINASCFTICPSS